MTNEKSANNDPPKHALDRRSLLILTGAAGVGVSTAGLAHGQASGLVDPRLAIAALVIACRGHWGLADNRGKIARRVHLEQALVSRLSASFVPAGSAIAPAKLVEIGEDLRRLVLPAKRTILASAGLEPVLDWERAHGPIGNAAGHLGMDEFEAQWVLRHVPEHAPQLPGWAWKWISDYYGLHLREQHADPELVDPAAALAAQQMGNPFAVQLAREYVLLKLGPSAAIVHMIPKWTTSNRFHERALSYAAWYAGMHGARVPTLMLMAGVLALADRAVVRSDTTPEADFYAGASALLAQDPTAVVDAIRDTLFTWFHYSPETWTRRPHVAWNPADQPTWHIVPQGAARGNVARAAANPSGGRA